MAYGGGQNDELAVRGALGTRIRKLNLSIEIKKAYEKNVRWFTYIFHIPCSQSKATKKLEEVNIDLQVLQNVYSDCFDVTFRCFDMFGKKKAVIIRSLLCSNQSVAMVKPIR